MTNTVNVLVRRARIIGTDRLYYSAWVPSVLMAPPGQMGHSSINGFGGHIGWWGEIGTERVPPELDALPAFSRDRSDRIGQWSRQNYARAHELICRAFPEAKDAFKPEMSGEMTMEDATGLPDDIKVLQATERLAYGTWARQTETA